MMHDVTLYDDARAAIHVDATCAALIAIGWVTKRVDVIDEITHHGAIAGAVHGGIWVLTFKTNEVDTDVVVIMNTVIRDRKKLHVAVQQHRFAPAELAIIDFIAVNEEIVDRGVRVSPVCRDTMRAAM